MKWLIPISSFLLACVSLLTLSSIAPDLVLRQFIYFVIGFGCFYGLSLIKFEQLRIPAQISYWLMILVLVLLLIIGRDTRQTVRWIDLFAGFKIQPSAFAALITSLFLAFQMHRLKLTKWKDLLRLIGIIVLPCLLIFLQPDFGSSLAILASLSIVFLMIPIKLKQILILVIAAVISLSVAWNFVLRPYQKARITSFFNTQEQQADLNASYNARQALIAVGSGQLYGRGLGFGVQSHLKFLPERQTDFVFASLAEEWGFIGSAVLVCVYFSLILVLLMFSLNLKDWRQQLYLLVLIMNLFIQVFINVGMNLGLLPITGITLPLVSYGGSSVIAFMISLGIAFGIIKQQKPSLKLWIK